MKRLIFRAVVVMAFFLSVSELRSAEARISSGFLARGEKALLEVLVIGSPPDQMPVIPEVKGLDIQVLGFGSPRMIPGRQIEYSIEFLVSSYENGVHEIPPMELMVMGVRQVTKPLRVEIFDPSELVWGEAVSKPEQIGDTVRYASIMKVPGGKFFENQTVETELKVYVPRDLASSLVDLGVPEFESDGLAVWRFESKETRGEVNLLGQSYIAISYGTTMTSTRSGAVTLGPATVRLTYVKMVFDRFTQRAEMQVTLDVAKRSLDITPLPDGAPDGYDKAVGEFAIGTAAMQKEVMEGEPISLDVLVSGRGNLDLIKSPKLLDDKGWKVYEATATQRGDERRKQDGTVVFKQFLRPLEIKSEIPPFRLVYFDPVAEEYKTVMTAPIPLNMKHATKTGIEMSGVTPKTPVPVERMTDILGLVGAGSLLSEGGLLFPPWTMHLLGGLFMLALIGRALWMRYGHLLERDEKKAKMKKDFEQVLNARGGDGAVFLRAAGGFAEKWLGGVDDAELRKVLEERDECCFRPDRWDVSLKPERKREIVQVLRRRAFGMLAFFMMLAVAGRADASDLAREAREAYDAAKFSEAAEIWLSAGEFEKLSADTMYNLGNAAYRMGAPGEAALYYRRALARNAGHEEARQNLRFLERKYGSITIERPAFQYALTKLSMNGWKNLFWGGLWMVVLGLLLFPATRPMARVRVAGVVGLIIGPLMMSVGALGWYYYPDDARFAPVERQGVIVAENVVLHTDAARTSPQVIDAPPGSLVEVKRVSGRWAYVAFATKTRGWVPVEYLGMLVPKEKPGVPKVRKALADGSSA